MYRIRKLSLISYSNLYASFTAVKALTYSYTNKQVHIKHILDVEFYCYNNQLKPINKYIFLWCVVYANYFDGII